MEDRKEGCYMYITVSWPLAHHAIAQHVDNDCISSICTLTKKRCPNKKEREEGKSVCWGGRERRVAGAYQVTYLPLVSTQHSIAPQNVQ